MSPKNAIKLEYDFEQTLDIATAAQNLLGLTDVEASVLFNGGPASAWPEKFARRWSESHENEREHPSRIAADLLEAVANGKVELDK